MAHVDLEEAGVAIAPLAVQAGRHCRHTGYVPAGMILAATGGRDLANEERTRFGQPPSPARAG